MPGTLDNSLGVIAPATGAIYGAGTGTYAFPSDTVRLAGTGTTESTTATALTVGSFASILVGANSVRIVWSSATAGTVATTSPLLPGGSKVDWLVTYGRQFVTIEAGDATSAYEAWVWQSSP